MFFETCFLGGMRSVASRPLLSLLTGMAFLVHRKIVVNHRKFAFGRVSQLTCVGSEFELFLM